MGGYGTVGIILLFGVLILTGYILLHSHGIKVILEDKELKRATTIIRIRNFAICLGLLSVAVYFLLISGLQAMPRGSAGYIGREVIATYLLYSGLVLLATAVYLIYIGSQPEFNFKRSLQRYAVKEKLRARMKFPQKPRSTKRNRTTRV